MHFLPSTDYLHLSHSKTNDNSRSYRENTREHATGGHEVAGTLGREAREEGSFWGRERQVEGRASVEMGGGCEPQ